jgi:hypothetical protein
LYKDLTGKKYNMLTVIGLSEIRTNFKGRKDAYWLCKCNCGNEKVIIAKSITTGGAKSCGCLFEKQKKDLREKNLKDSFINNTKVELIMKTDSNKNNKSSGVRGVYYAKHCSRWYSKFTYQDKDYFLGYFDTVEEAEKAYKIAKNNLCGDFLKSIGKEVANA